MHLFFTIQISNNKIAGLGYLCNGENKTAWIFHFILLFNRIVLVGIVYHSGWYRPVCSNPKHKLRIPDSQWSDRMKIKLPHIDWFLYCFLTQPSYVIQLESMTYKQQTLATYCVFRIIEQKGKQILTPLTLYINKTNSSKNICLFLFIYILTTFTPNCEKSYL